MRTHCVRTLVRESICGNALVLRGGWVGGFLRLGPGLLCGLEASSALELSSYWDSVDDSSSFLLVEVDRLFTGVIKWLYSMDVGLEEVAFNLTSFRVRFRTLGLYFDLGASICASPSAGAFIILNDVPIML